MRNLGFAVMVIVVAMANFAYAQQQPVTIEFQIDFGKTVAMREIKKIYPYDRYMNSCWLKNDRGVAVRISWREKNEVSWEQINQFLDLANGLIDKGWEPVGPDVPRANLLIKIYLDEFEGREEVSAVYVSRGGSAIGQSWLFFQQTEIGHPHEANSRVCCRERLQGTGTGFQGLT